jgi:hypothetical protein
MRTHLNIIDGMGVTKRLALFSSKSDSGVHVVVRTEQSVDPIALDKSYQSLGHVVAPDQGALWQELLSHPKKINYDPVMISHSPQASRARRFGLI